MLAQIRANTGRQVAELSRGFRRFSMRGATKARGEWSLLCTVHNLLKLAARRA